MNFLSAFWAWLTATPKRRSDAGNPDIFPIDVKAVADELHLRAEAKRLGEAGVPNPNAHELCGVEAAVVQIIEKTRNQYVAWAERRLGIHNESIARRDVTALVQRALIADTQLEVEARDKFAEQKSSLEATKEYAARSQRELDEFRARHLLRRDARYPTKSKSILLLTMLVATVGIEAFVNGSYFAEGNNDGILGGIREAAVYAGLNVAVAYAFGRIGIRYVNHRSIGWKVIGALAVMGFIGAALFIALLITHLRNAFASGAQDAQTNAIQNLLATPFFLGGADSVTLFFFSLGFALFAMWDGLIADDRYPGYGEVTRTAAKTREEFDSDVQEMREELVELRQEHLDSFDKQIRDSQSGLALVTKEIDWKEATSARLHQAILDADNSMDALLKEFRTENEVHRGSAPLPAYFPRKHVLSTLALPSFDTSGDRKALRNQEALVTTLIASEQEIRSRMHQVFESQMAPIESFENIFAEREVT